MRRARLLPIVIAFIGLASAAVFGDPGDDPSVGIIVYAEGETITVLREQVQTRYDAALGDSLGEPLYAGNQVSTDAGTFAEIQLLSSSNIVKLAENTTFVVDELSGGRSRLHLTYGRMRARVEQLAGAGRFEMRGLTAVAGVRGTDFGYDQIVDPITGELLERVYCFEGEIHVSAAANRGLATVVPAGGMIVVGAGADPESISVIPIDDAITRYWAARPFIRDIESAGALLDEFPLLSDRVESDLGLLPAVLVQAASARVAEQPDVAPAEESEAPDSRDDAGAPDDSGLAERVQAPTVAADSEPVVDEEAERRARVGRGLRTTGIVLAVTGLVIDIAAVGLYYFGEDIVPGWTEENNRILGPLAASGVGLLAGGIIAIMISLGVNN